MVCTAYLSEFSLSQLTEWFLAQGQPAYRAKQVYRHIYRHLTGDFQEMTDLPVMLRERLAQNASLKALRLVTKQISADGLTQKAVFALPDGQTIESVLMLYSGNGKEASTRRTVCVSTQVGCPLNCAFCATGRSGFVRNLSAGEIVEQVLYFARGCGSQQGEVPKAGNKEKARGPANSITNVIFAGMGEPFLNYDATWEAVQRLNDPAGFGLGARHITISTAGWVPGIERLSKERLQVNLAVSLHAPDDALRNRLMPVNQRYPLASLLAACQRYVENTGRRVTFEYILIDGINAALEQAHALAALLKGWLCHVNLIPMNPVPESPWQPPPRRTILAFEETLRQAGITTTLRVDRGSDIQAACGQLRGRICRGIMA